MPGSGKELHAAGRTEGAGPDIWSSYWHGPRLVCSLATESIGYPQALQDVWRRFFETLQGGTRLLDIATGNGAVAIIANEAARALGRHFDIHASDRADIDPVTHLRGTGLLTDGITFHPNTPAEATPFPDAHFDAVTGQFALEYTDMAATVREISRILKPGGQARFILHMRDSEIDLQTRQQLRDIHLALDELQILLKARRMLAAAYAFEQAGSQDQTLLLDAERARQEYIQAARVIDGAVPTSAYKELFIAILKMVAYHWEHRRESVLEQFAARVDEMEGEIRRAERRHAAMCEHALDETRMQELQACFERNGFRPPAVQILRITMGGKNGAVGWDMRTYLGGPGTGGQA